MFYVCRVRKRNVCTHAYVKCNSNCLSYLRCKKRQQAGPGAVRVRVTPHCLRAHARVSVDVNTCKMLLDHICTRDVLVNNSFPMSGEPGVVLRMTFHSHHSPPLSTQVDTLIDALRPTAR